MSAKKIKPTNIFPTHWEACTKEQLEYLQEHGSYGQRKIAERYLKTRKKKP